MALKKTEIEICRESTRKSVFTGHDPSKISEPPQERKFTADLRSSSAAAGSTRSRTTMAMIWKLLRTLIPIPIKTKRIFKKVTRRNRLPRKKRKPPLVARKSRRAQQRPS